MKRTLDTNILINLERWYPRDIFGFLWQGVEDAVSAGDVCICTAVHNELKRGGDALYDWAKNTPGFVCPLSQADMLEASQISNQYPGWVQQSKNAADPELIAHASNEGREIVSEEKRKGPGAAPHNIKVPNVADDLGISCIDFFTFVRAMGWKAA